MLKTLSRSKPLSSFIRSRSTASISSRVATFHARQNPSKILALASATCIITAYTLTGDSLFADTQPELNGVDLITSVSLDYDAVAEARRNVGMYAWGSNSSKLIDGASIETAIRSPQSIKASASSKSGALRDVALTETYAVAVDKHGDVYQWGVGFNGSSQPLLILKNRDIKQVVCAAGELLMLSKTGYVYSLPIALADQQLLMKTRLAALKSRYTDLSYWTMSAEERCLDRFSTGGMVSKIAGAMSLSKNGNAFGQLGQDSVETVTPHKFLSVPTLALVTDIACGFNHTLFTTAGGKIYGVGSNQLASGAVGEIPAIIQSPTEIQTIWSRFQKAPQPEGSECVMIAAGADLSYFAVKGEQGSELLAAGYGVNAQLGNGSPHPALIKRLSNLSEWDDSTNSVKQIGVHDLQVSSTHTVAILSNERSTSFGRDVFVWGLNQKGQLNKIDGKKSVAATPVWAAAINYSGDGKAQGRISLSPAFLVEGVKVEQALACGPGITVAYMRVV